MRPVNLQPVALPAKKLEALVTEPTAGDLLRDIRRSRIRQRIWVGLAAAQIVYMALSRSGNSDEWEDGACPSVAGAGTPGRSIYATYCRKPIQPSAITIEFPGLRESYFTEVGRPSRQDCRLIHCRR